MFVAQSSAFAFELFYPLFLTGLPEHNMISKAKFTLLNLCYSQSAADKGGRERKREREEPQTNHTKQICLLAVKSPSWFFNDH